MKQKQCKCGADIAFIEMVSGKKMPVDVKAEQMVMVAEEDPDRDIELGRMVKVYRPHWGTCPLAKQFKKKGD